LQILLYYFPGIRLEDTVDRKFYEQQGNLFLCNPYKVED